LNYYEITAWDQNTELDTKYKPDVYIMITSSFSFELLSVFLG